MSWQFKVALITLLLWLWARATTKLCVKRGDKDAALLAAFITILLFLTWIVTGLWGLFIL